MKTLIVALSLLLLSVSPLPDKITLSLVLPGAGTVSISDVGLYQ